MCRRVGACEAWVANMTPAVWVVEQPFRTGGFLVVEQPFRAAGLAVLMRCATV